MNTAIIQAAQGLCFAIPINTVKFVAGQLMMDGKIRRGYLGFGGQAVRLPPALRQSLEIEETDGIYVVGLEEGGPAEATGLREGDVVIGFDGQAVRNVDDLHRLLTEDRIGAPGYLTVLREGRKLYIRIVPAEFPETKSA